MVLVVFLMSFILAGILLASLQLVWFLAHICHSWPTSLHNIHPCLPVLLLICIICTFFFSLILAFLTYIGTWTRGWEGKEALLCREAPIAATHLMLIHNYWGVEQEHGIPCIPGLPFPPFQIVTEIVKYLWRALNFGRSHLSESKVVSTRRRDAVRWGEGVGLRSVAQTVISLYVESALLKLILWHSRILWCGI